MTPFALNMLNIPAEYTLYEFGYHRLSEWKKNKYFWEFITNSNNTGHLAVNHRYRIVRQLTREERRKKVWQVSPPMSKEDVQLSAALLEDLCPLVVAEKMEVSPSQFIKDVMVCDFPLTDRLIQTRLKTNKMRFEGLFVEKYCPNCNKFLALIEDFWAPSRQTPDGAHGFCKECEAIRKNKLWHEKKLKSSKQHKSKRTEL